MNKSLEIPTLFFTPCAGQHDCVTVINNFFSRARLEYYTRPQGSENEPKLPPKLADPLHKIIMTTNLNPVNVGGAKCVYVTQISSASKLPRLHKPNNASGTAVYAFL